MKFNKKIFSLFFFNLIFKKTEKSEFISDIVPATFLLDLTNDDPNDNQIV